MLTVFLQISRMLVILSQLTNQLLCKYSTDRKKLTNVKKCLIKMSTFWHKFSCIKGVIVGAHKTSWSECNCLWHQLAETMCKMQHRKNWDIEWRQASIGVENQNIYVNHISHYVLNSNALRYLITSWIK